MTGTRAELWWLPVGAGGHVVVHTSRWWERLQARREHRVPEPLLHAALEVYTDSCRYVVEMTPAWGQPAEARGVLASGSVGFRPLGHLRLFRYEVRAWPDGVLPDRAFAVGPPVTVPLTADGAAALLGQLRHVPPLTWGRTVRPTGDMWNSNSLVSWLLTTAGIDAARLVPAAGRAPGWSAGIAVAGRGRGGR